MTVRSTRHSTTRLWTGIITLLVISGSASSQASTTLNEAAPSLHTEAITESPSGSVEQLRKVNVTDRPSSSALKYVGNVPEARAEGTIVDELQDSFTSKSDGSKDELSVNSGGESEKLRVKESLAKFARTEDKSVGNSSLPELSVKEDNGEIDDLQGENGREPTTKHPETEVDRSSEVPKDAKHKGKEASDESPEERTPEIGISLAGDTKVNYNSKKSVNGSKDESVLGDDLKESKSAAENATNVITSGAEAGEGEVKGKGPKAQVEVVKNSTLPKTLRISEAGPEAERKEVESLGSAKQESLTETSESTVSLESKDLAKTREKTRNSTVANGDDVDYGKDNDTKALQTPKGRTISFGGSNEFVTNDNKTEGTIRDNGGTISDRTTITHVVPGATKEPVQELRSTEFKPYPYAKVNYQSNSSEVAPSGNAQVAESTEEASALENTIGQRQQNKKFVVTEPSLVIDNSIQNFKPTYFKRPGNSSRIPTSSFTAIPTIASGLVGEEASSETTLNAKPIALDNHTTAFLTSLPISNTENDVPRGKDEAAKSSIDAKDTSNSLDLTGNGITEVITGVKNDSAQVIEDSVTTISSSLTTGGLTSMSRVPDKNLVQNSTEKIATINEETVTNVDFQTSSEESMIDISSLGVTEGSTVINANQGDINVDPSAMTLSTSTIMPEIGSAKSNSTTETSVSTPAPSKIISISMSTLMSEIPLTPAIISEGSTVSTLITETSSSISTINSAAFSMSNLSSMASSVSTSIPAISSMSLKATSASVLNTDLEVQVTTEVPEGSTNGPPGESFKTAESLIPDELVESTTSKIEYVFVGLTESSASQQYIATSESSNAVTVDVEVPSSSPSSATASSTVAVVSTTDGSSNNESESTAATETPEQIPTEPVTLFGSSNSSEDSATTEATIEFTTLEDSTISVEEDTAETTTTIEDLTTTPTNESVETTTEEVANVTNSTNVLDVNPDVRKNSTDTGRAVATSTSGPDAIGTSYENSGIITTIGSMEETSPSITTEVPRFSEVPRILSTNFTTKRIPTESPTTQKSSTNATSKSQGSSPTSRTLITKPTTSSPKLDTTATPEDTGDVATDDSIEISSRGGVPSLIKVVFDGTWAIVCPHLDTLRQSLADLLTAGLEKTILASQIIYQNNPCTGGFAASSTTTTDSSVTTLLLYVVDEDGNFDGEMTRTLPSLYRKSPVKLQVNIRSFQLVQDSDSGNAIAVVVVSCVALICLVLLAGLLFIMRKRQTRFNYGERCRPVSLDAYSLDSVSAYNSVRRKGAARASKRSYGNPTFEDSTAIPSHPLNFGGLSTFCNEQNAISEEFAGIPQVTARIDELPPGAEVKNRYANVVPLPETRVSLMKVNNDPLTEYINASYVRGPKNATKYYIACQAPIDSTVTDFWRMIWEQQSKVVIMLTDLVENGVEKCAEYIPPSEVTDCHRLFGDFQVTLKKRETKEKYAISTLHLKNLENNTFREISHIWYLWPANGVQSDAAGLIAVLLEARALQRGGPGPIVVHCSPGTGRTGTLIALDLGIRQYEITRTVDVPRVVYTIRRDRAGAVQTKEQYAFIYKALNLYATKLAGGALES